MGGPFVEVKGAEPITDDEGRVWIKCYQERWKVINPDGSEQMIRRDGVVTVSAGPSTQFAKGNLVGLKYGVRSSHEDGLLSVRAAEVCEVLVGVYPWILDTDVVAIEQYCRAEALARMADEAVQQVAAEKGFLSVPPYLLKELSTANGMAMRAADRLGLSPEGRLRIAKDAGFAQHFSSQRVDTLRAQGAALRATNE